MAAHQQSPGKTKTHMLTDIAEGPAGFGRPGKKRGGDIRNALGRLGPRFFCFFFSPPSSSPLYHATTFDDSLLVFPLLLYSHVILRFIGALSSYIFSQLGLPEPNKYQEKEVGRVEGGESPSAAPHTPYQESHSVGSLRKAHCPGPNELSCETRCLRSGREGADQGGRKGEKS